MSFRAAGVTGKIVCWKLSNQAKSNCVYVLPKTPSLKPNKKKATASQTGSQGIAECVQKRRETSGVQGREGASAERVVLVKIIGENQACTIEDKQTSAAVPRVRDG